MGLEAVRSKAEELWHSGDNLKLFEYLYKERKVFVDEDTELGYMYFLSAIDRDNITNYGKHGILYSDETLKGVMKNISALKRIIHRIEWCDETDPMSVLECMKRCNATPIDLKWFIDSSTIDQQYVLGRIGGTVNAKGNCPPQTLYYDPEIRLDGEEIAFVICSNDEEQLEEAKYYISRLYVPEGCSVNVLAIYGADSLCGGYNEAIDASKARFKVYMHHDVRILDRFFLYYLIKIFEDDPQIGMLGMIGTKGIPKDGIMWNENRYGAWIECHVHQCASLSRYEIKNTTDVGVADGFLLATQKDLRWRDDLFDGWDFYDASQCMEFHNKGYRVVVPYQEHPWCLHDCGYWNLEKYDKYKEVFLENYS